MPTFIKLLKKDRIKLFRLAKAKSKTSFNKMFPRFNICRAMFYNYLSGRYDLPKNIFLELKEIAELNIDNYKEIEKEKYCEKEIIEPKLDESLAEIFGVLNGDGHIAPLNHEICVVLSNLERDYLDYIKKLFEKTLKLSFKIYERNTVIKLRTNSKRMADHLHEIYGLPKGNKMGNLKIPDKLLESKKLLIPYFRGLYDTDGTFYIRRKKDPVVEISSADPNFLIQLQNFLISLDFKVGKGATRIFIYNKDHIKRFFEIIRPANTKHLKKYQNYLENSAPLV